MAELYRSVYEGDDHGEAWHGPALKSLLKGITSGQASRSPQGKGHSILQLVLHMAYWEEIELRRFNGEVVDAPLKLSSTLAEAAGSHSVTHLHRRNDFFSIVGLQV